MGVEIHIEGLDELQANLERLGTETAKRLLGAALKDNANMVRDAIVEAAPRDTGFLADHFDVKLRAEREDIAATAFIGPSKRNYPYRGETFKFLKKKFGRTVAVASVARFLEFGTHKMAARPFMRPAWERIREVVLDNFIKEMRDLIAVVSNK
jgi:HK97 gp10 family phage protein